MDLINNNLLLNHIVDPYNPENNYIDRNLLMVYMYHLNMVHLNMYWFDFDMIDLNNLVNMNKFLLLNLFEYMYHYLNKI
jgi:hypothetical protein